MKIKFLSLFLVLSVFALETNVKAQGSNTSSESAAPSENGAPATSSEGTVTSTGNNPAPTSSTGNNPAPEESNTGVFGSPADVTAPAESSGTNN